MSAKRSSTRHSAFFDLEKNPERDSLTRPQSMLRGTEWGGLTLVSLLAGLAFPPYFVAVMALACLNAGGMLWVTHLNEEGRRRLREFEEEFSRGHALEERGDYRVAADFYAALAPRYAKFPRIAQIALHRVGHLHRTQPQAFPPPDGPAASPAGAGTARDRAGSGAGVPVRPGPGKTGAGPLRGLGLELKRKPA